MHWNPEKDLVVFGPEIWNLQDQGGISRYFSELILRLNNVGVKVLCLHPKSSNIYLEKIPDSIKLQVEFSANRICQWFNYLSLLRFVRPNSVYHPTYYARIPSIFFSKFAKLHNVVTVHDMIEEVTQSDSVSNQFMNGYKAKMILRTKSILAVSNNTKNDLVKLLRIPPETISVSYLGVNLTSEPDKIRNFDRKDPFFLYVGKRDGYKNFELLLKAFSVFHEINDTYRIIAVGGEEVSVKEMKLISDLRLSGFVEFVPADDQQLVAYYTTASALVYPSLYEGFGLPPLEAMTLGCPVIASKTSSIPEVCGDVPLYFNPFDVDSLVDAFNQLFSSRDLTDSRILKGLLQAKKYSWDSTMSNTLTFYRSL